MFHRTQVARLGLVDLAAVAPRPVVSLRQAVVSAFATLLSAEGSLLASPSLSASGPLADDQAYQPDPSALSSHEDDAPARLVEPLAPDVVHILQFLGRHIQRAPPPVLPTDFVVACMFALCTPWQPDDAKAREALLCAFVEAIEPPSDEESAGATSNTPGGLRRLLAALKTRQLFEVAAKLEWRVGDVEASLQSSWQRCAGLAAIYRQLGQLAAAELPAAELQQQTALLREQRAALLPRGGDEQDWAGTAAEQLVHERANLQPHLELLLQAWLRTVREALSGGGAASSAATQAARRMLQKHAVAVTVLEASLGGCASETSECVSIACLSVNQTQMQMDAARGAASRSWAHVLFGGLQGASIHCHAARAPGHGGGEERAARRRLERGAGCTAAAVSGAAPRLPHRARARQRAAGPVSGALRRRDGAPLVRAFLPATCTHMQLICADQAAKRATGPIPSRRVQPSRPGGVQVALLYAQLCCQFDERGVVELLNVARTPPSAELRALITDHCNFEALVVLHQLDGDGAAALSAAELQMRAALLELRAFAERLLPFASCEEACEGLEAPGASCAVARLLRSMLVAAGAQHWAEGSSAFAGSIAQGAQLRERADGAFESLRAQQAAASAPDEVFSEAQRESVRRLLRTGLAEVAVGVALQGHASGEGTHAMAVFGASWQRFAMQMVDAAVRQCAEHADEGTALIQQVMADLEAADGELQGTVWGADAQALRACAERPAASAKQAGWLTGTQAALSALREQPVRWRTALLYVGSVVQAQRALRRVRESLSAVMSGEFFEVEAQWQRELRRPQLLQLEDLV